MCTEPPPRCRAHTMCELLIHDGSMLMKPGVVVRSCWPEPSGATMRSCMPVCVCSA